MLRLSNRYTASNGRHELVVRVNPATRALVLQAIEEQARTSRTSTELPDEYEIFTIKNTIWRGSDYRQTGDLANMSDARW